MTNTDLTTTEYDVICLTEECQTTLATKLQTRAEAEALTNAHNNTHNTQIIPIPKLFATPTRHYQKVTQ